MLRTSPHSTIIPVLPLLKGWTFGKMKQITLGVINDNNSSNSKNLIVSHQ